MNPMAMMKLTAAMAKFSSTHPKFARFLTEVPKHALKEGAIVEISITDPEGKTYSSNMKVMESDLELYNELKNLKNG